ncbi:tubulin--tyrosine ligase, putative, partial [Plasmodium malariae]
MNNFSKPFNIKHKNEISECKKGNISEVVPKYTLLNNASKLSKEYSTLNIVANNKIDIDEMSLRKFKGDEHMLLSKNVNYLVGTTTECASTINTQKTNLVNVSVKNDSYRKNVGNYNNVNFLYNPGNLNNQKSLYNRHNMQNVNMKHNSKNYIYSREKENPNNSSENEKSDFEHKYFNTSIDYLSKVDDNLNKKFEKKKYLYFDSNIRNRDKVNKLTLETHIDNEKEYNNIKKYVDYRPIYKSAKNDNLHNYNLLQKTKVGRSLSHINNNNNNNESKKEYSEMEMSINKLIHKGGINKTDGISLEGLQKSYKTMQFDDHNDIKNKNTNRIKQWNSYVRNNLTDMKQWDQKYNHLPKNMNKTPINDDENILIRTISYNNMNDKSVSNLNMMKNVYSSSIFFFNENNKEEGKNIKTNSSKNIVEESQLLRKEIKNHDIMNNTSTSKYCNIILKSNIKSSGLYEKKAMNVNKNEYPNNKCDNPYLINNSKFCINTVENNKSNSGCTSNLCMNDNRQRYFRNNFSGNTNKCNISCNNYKLLYNESKKEENLLCDILKNSNVSGQNSLHETLNMVELSSNCINNNTIKILDKEKASNKKNNTSLFYVPNKGCEEEQNRKGEWKKSKKNSNCLIRDMEHKYNGKTNVNIGHDDFLLNGRLKKNSNVFINQNRCYLKNKGDENYYSLMRNYNEYFRKDDFNRNYILKKQCSQNLHKSCNITSNDTNNVKNDNIYNHSYNNFELIKDGYSVRRHSNIGKNNEVVILKNAENRNNDFTVNMKNDNVYCTSGSLSNKNYKEGNNYVEKSEIVEEHSNNIENGTNKKINYCVDKYTDIGNMENRINNSYSEQKNYLNIHNYIISNNEMDEKNEKKSTAYYMQNYKNYTKNHNRNKMRNVRVLTNVIRGAANTAAVGSTYNRSSSSNHNKIGYEGGTVIQLSSMNSNQKRNINQSDHINTKIILSNRNKTQFKDPSEHYYTRNSNILKTIADDRSNTLVLASNNSIKYKNSNSVFNKENVDIFYNYDENGRGFIRGLEGENYYNRTEKNVNSKEEVHVQLVTCNNPYMLDNNINIHKSKNQKNQDEQKEKKEKEEKEETINKKVDEEEKWKVEMKENIFLKEPMNGCKNREAVKYCNMIKREKESKSSNDTIIEVNNVSNEKNDSEKKNTFEENYKKKREDIILKGGDSGMVVKAENEKEIEGINESNIINEKQSSESFYKYNENINDIKRIKNSSCKNNVENNEKSRVLISISNDILKEPKKGSTTIENNNNNKNDDSAIILEVNNYTYNEYHRRVNLYNLEYDKKNENKYIMSKNICNLGYNEKKKSIKEQLTDSYSYHLNNMNKNTKLKNKKRILGINKNSYKTGEKHTLSSSNIEKEDVKKKYTVENITDMDIKKEKEGKYESNEKIGEENNVNEGKKEDINFIGSNGECRYPISNELSRYKMNITKKKYECDVAVKDNTYLEEENIHDKENQIFNELNGVSNEKISFFDTCELKNREMDNSCAYKNDREKCNFLIGHRLSNAQELFSNNSINDRSKKDNNAIKIENNFCDTKKWVGNYTTDVNNERNNSSNNDSCESRLRDKNEIVITNKYNNASAGLDFKKESKKGKKVVLPWNKDNIVKLNGKNKSMKKKNITINTKLARYERVLIHTCINKLNWKKCIENINKGTFYWIGYNINDYDHYNYMKKKKIINRIPSMYMYTKKKALTFLLSHLSLIFPALYDFYPNTFVLPENKNIIKYILNSDNKEYYIMKPDCGSMGIGVKVINKYSDININILNGYNCYIIQKYIDNPLLMYKKKFDFRIYILLLPGKNYPKIYLSKVGFARLCTEEYKKKKRYICNTYIHLTNYSINKDNEKYIRKKNIHDKNNNKQLLSDVFIYLKNIGYDIDDIWGQIKKITCLTSLAIYSYIKGKIQYNFNNNFYFYQLIGLDILLDNTGKAWLLEVNSNPSLRIDYIDPSYTNFEIQLESMFDRYVKEPVISEMFLIVYQKIYKKYLRKKSKKVVISVNDKIENKEKHNIICTINNKRRLLKIKLKDGFSNNSFIHLNNSRNTKGLAENKKPHDKNSNNNNN